MGGWPTREGKIVLGYGFAGQCALNPIHSSPADRVNLDRTYYLSRLSRRPAGAYALLDSWLRGPSKAGKVLRILPDSPGLGLAFYGTFLVNW